MRVAIRSLPPIRWVPHRPILRTQRINRHPRIIPIRRRLLIQIRDTLCLIGNGRQGQLLLAGSVVSPLLDHHGLSEILVGGAHDGEAVDVGGRGGRVPVAGGGAGVGGVGGRAVEVGGAGHFAWTGWATFVLSSATALFTILCTCHINQEQGVKYICTILVARTIRDIITASTMVAISTVISGWEKGDGDVDAIDISIIWSGLGRMR